MPELICDRVAVSATINGEPAAFLCEPRDSLLEVLRDRLGLTGAKEGCNNGNCGACNVLLDGRLVNSCCVLGVEANGKDVLTIEGVAQNGQLHPLQQAFLEEAALQCGICTPGMLMAGQAYLEAGGGPSDEQIREAIAGNLCRCTGYTKIIDAIALSATEANPVE